MVESRECGEAVDVATLVLLDGSALPAVRIPRECWHPKHVPPLTSVPITFVSPQRVLHQKYETQSAGK